MGICLSRRAMQASSSENAEADSAGASSKLRSRHGKAAGCTGNEVDMINPARLLLESPRISTGEMGMLGLFFQKKYCKPLQHHQQHGYEKLTPMEEKKKKAECELGLEADMATSGILKGATMTANVLFEKDEYPTFEPNFRPAAAAAGQAAAESVVVAVAAGRVENEEDARRSKDSNAVNECSRGDQMWASAGEDFFSDWEDRSERSSSGIRGGSTSAGAPEIGVFEAEQYFKEEPRASAFHDASNNNNDDESNSTSTSEALLRPNKQPAEASRSSELKPTSRGSGVGSSSGIRWVSTCAAASAVQIDGGEAFVDHGRTLRRAKSKAELQLSKMFKLLGSSSSSSQAKHKPRISMATTTTRTTTGKRQQQHQQQHRSNENTKPSKSSKIRESHVKNWMDKARKSSDGIFALGQEDQDQQHCNQKPSSNSEQQQQQQPQHADLNLLSGSSATAADAHHQPLTPKHSGQPVGFTFSGSTTDSSAAGALNESATSTHNQGFGSPFPASPNSDQKQQPEEPRIVVSAVASSSSSSRDRLPARPRPRAKSNRSIIQQHQEQVVALEGDVGNESDSSSDLFELDSVTTSLSSARSSLSRLSSARSSIRKSTADEQDLLQLQFCCDNKSAQSAVLAATLRANVLESSPPARGAVACNFGAAEDAAVDSASSATKNHDSLRERVSSISSTDSQAVIGSRGGSAAAAGGITANEENKPPPTNRRAKSDILLSGLSSSSRHSLNARSVAPWNNSNGVLAVQT